MNGRQRICPRVESSEEWSRVVTLRVGSGQTRKTANKLRLAARLANAAYA